MINVIKKTLCLVFVCLLFTGMACKGVIAAPADYGIGVVNGKTSDRVHLREEASTRSKSLGLYFTGTQLRCMSDPAQEWVIVNIGGQRGWMMSEYLYTGGNPNNITPKQPYGVVVNKKAGSGGLNIYDQPSYSSAVAGTLYGGSIVIILGETWDHWYYIGQGEQGDYIPAEEVYMQGDTYAAYGTAVINGKTSDRVHLREESSAQSKSLGLYFTGTRVRCQSDPQKQWVKVNIGSETGYVKSEFLYTGSPNNITPKWPRLTIVQGGAGDGYSVYTAPFNRTLIEDTLKPGMIVKVLGETADRWYYIEAENLRGYIFADYLPVGVSSFHQPAQAATADFTGEFEMMTYTDGNNITIQYPRFSGIAFQGLNGLMVQKVEAMAKNEYEEEGLKLTLQYQCQVTLHNADMVSMVFWGEGYVEGGAHPYTNLIGFNVDLKTLTEVELRDLYRVDDAFTQRILEKAFYPTWPVTAEYGLSFIEMLEHELSTENMITCFLKPDGLVISMGATHASGSDHFEAQVNYGDVEDFYQAGQRYWE